MNTLSLNTFSAHPPKRKRYAFITQASSDFDAPTMYIGASQRTKIQGETYKWRASRIPLMFVARYLRKFVGTIKLKVDRDHAKTHKSQ